jgi:PPM family protein phosphatase
LPAVAARSHRSARSDNQDRVFVTPTLLVLADGIGGHPGGRQAAQAAVGGASRDLPDPITSEGIVRGFVAASEAVAQVRLGDPRYSEAGCTFTVVAVRPAIGLDLLTCVVAHVGDSPALLVREGELTLLTPPHTVSDELVRAGRLAEVDVATHPGRNTLSRSLGSRGLEQPDVREFELIEGDRLLVASDGLLDVPDRRELRRLASRAAPVRDVVDQLADYALRTSRDNVTVAMLDPYADEDDVTVSGDG